MKWLMLSVVFACLIGGGLLIAFEKGRRPPADGTGALEHKPTEPIAAPVEVPTATPQAAAPAATNESNLVDDDGKTLWASPTTGAPLDLAYLPPGSQIIVAMRPAELVKHGEGAKVLAALGPLGQRAIQYLEEAIVLRFGDIQSLLVSCQATSNGEWQMAFVAHAVTPVSLEPLTKLSGATSQSHAGKKYLLVGERAYYVPEERKGQILVVAPPPLMKDIIDLAGAAPPLRRDIERLLAHTDVGRQLTLLVAPNFLFSEGQGMLSGEMAQLRGPLFWFLGDGLSAAALSMNWDENFFVELVAMPTLDISADKAANQLAERIHEMPDLMEDYVLRLNAQPYGRRVVARFPAMMRKLATYTRSGVEDGAAVLRCYLPAAAGHNLILGAELTLAEGTGASVPANVGASNMPSADFGKLSPGDAVGPGVATGSVRELLQRTTSLSFTRDSLEAALEQLSQDIGVEIIIVGPDLQADGITRNQQLGIHIENQPAADILVEILRKANPDKTATSANDKRQKLVYVVKPKTAGGPEAVFVTTRARAAERKEELPAAFRP